MQISFMTKIHLTNTDNAWYKRHFLGFGSKGFLNPNKQPLKTLIINL